MEAHKIINIHTRFSMTENDTSIFNSLNLDLSVLF